MSSCRGPSVMPANMSVRWGRSLSSPWGQTASRTSPSEPVDKRRAGQHPKRLQKIREAVQKNSPTAKIKWTYLESARFEQHDLIMLAETLKAWDALCKLHYFLHSRGEALGKRLPHLLTGAAGWSHRTWIEWTCLQWREDRTCYGFFIFFFLIDRLIEIHKLSNKTLTNTLAPPFSFQGQGLWFWESLAGWLFWVAE